MGAGTRRDDASWTVASRMSLLDMPLWILEFQNQPHLPFLPRTLALHLDSTVIPTTRERTDL